MENPLNPVQKRKYLLLLIRHGKAAPKNVGLSDFERILTKTGVEESKRVAAATRDKLRSIDLMLSSPADRALETAHIFARNFKYPVQKIQVFEKVYSADSIQPLVEHIRGLGHIARTVAIFGHNPLFDELAAYLVPGFSRTMPKSAVLGIEFEAISWADISKVKGRLLFFLAPWKNGVQFVQCVQSAGKQ
jgi:phosphohistidine phosphatase